MTAPNLAPVNCRYGAPMGRPDRHSLCPDATRTFYLMRVPLDRGGYDRGGAYWGIGGPLYWATCSTGSIDFYFRAPGRAAAKNEVLKRYPNAKFYR